MVEKSIGVCLGASNVKLVELTRVNGDISVTKKIIRNHESNPRRVFRELVGEFNIPSYEFGALTGRKFRDIVKATSITEPEALEEALDFSKQQGENLSGNRILISLGSENFIAYMLTADGHIATIETGNKCASGTGEFFRQQIRRMDISTDEAVRVAKNAEVYSVSGRCSVFCKSDCTHALNKGVPIGRVTAGLCLMMAEKVIDLLEKSQHRSVIAVGGVTQNVVVLDHLRERIESLTVPKFANYFEAIGAAWHALRTKTKLHLSASNLFRERRTSFSFHPPLETAESLVEFKPHHRGQAEEGDRCVIGLDVGSTTTKSVVFRLRDRAILASTYLRTNGDPVSASRNCYSAMLDELDVDVELVGLGVTGSGRSISGLHAGTKAIINEIIAHAAGAAHFDPKVDTIFEIGGQDAKYTHLTNAVPSDYAMNEACSAGTGSFLEEAAYESLGIDYREIEKIAVLGKKPPNFNDQCAAFISSDIKTATHEGIGREDIVAGLVYSICMNYTNRVKGQRPVGNKIFMQGGVCYNRAVPLAMANLIERPIIVPPDPGLIGAFGVALETANRLEMGLLEEQHFDLRELAAREIEYGRSFICKGGKERCDRACEISMIIVDGKRKPFGGACNRYYNRRQKITVDSVKLDLVRRRQKLVFDRGKASSHLRTRPQIGLNRSYLTNTLYPLFYTFFDELGCDVILPDKISAKGIKKRRSSFCFPGEISHGFFYDLLQKNPDYIFLPKIMTLDVKNAAHAARERKSTCVLLQSESYYLKSTFKNIPSSTELLTPIIDFADGLDSQAEVFIKLGKTLGRNRRCSLAAYRRAFDAQLDFTRRMKSMGRRILRELERSPEKSAVVLFGRSYNAFAREANMGIPTKFASRSMLVIPWDCLAYEYETASDQMCWAIGQDLMKAAQLVKKHPQLFGAWVTNFSCGPDSFLVGYFRDIMQSKPSLTLELDSHTADAGVNTRIEAFLDIVERYRELNKNDPTRPHFKPASMYFDKGIPIFVTSDGEEVSFLNQERVHLLIPSMGHMSSEILAAFFRGAGVRADPTPIYRFDELKLGRANSTCKECLPLQLVVGGLLQHINSREDDDELLAYFMPFTPGNCRFPQYRYFIDNIIQKNALENVTQFTLNAEKGYTYEAFDSKERINVLKSLIIADIMEDIKNALTVLAKDKESALSVFNKQWKDILNVFQKHQSNQLYPCLNRVVSALKSIPLKYPLSEAKKVALVGEVFVRRDYFSSGELMERLIENEIIVKRSHFFEWLKYVDEIVRRGIYEPNFTFKDRLQFEGKLFFQSYYEKKLKNIFTSTGLYDYELIDLQSIFNYGENFFDIRFRGESILIVGGFFKDILHGYHGMVNIGPFACMPTRVIEAVLGSESTMDVKRRLDGDNGKPHNTDLGINDLPFLTIETDGNPFPQILEARIEAFCLQVDRLHRKALEHPQEEPPPKSIRNSFLPIFPSLGRH